MSSTPERAEVVVLVAAVSTDRLTGTPVRIRTTFRALRDLFDTHLIATGGEDARVVADVWRQRATSEFSLRKFTRGALAELNKIKPDVIHAVTAAAVLPCLIYKLRHPSTRLIFEMHGVSRFEMIGASRIARTFYARLDKWALRGSDAVIAMSYKQKTYVEKVHPVSRGKVEVIWGPLDVDETPYVPPPDADELVVGYLGNDAFWQGVDVLLEAASSLQEHPAIRFRFAGFKPPEGLDLRTSEFLGPIPRESGSTFLSGANILVSPRVGGAVTDLQYPHKLSYYLAAGRPVLVSDVSDQADIVRRVDCGRVFAPQDARSLIEGLLELAALSREERVKMGERARKFAEEELSMPAFKRGLLHTYNLGPR